MLSNLFCRKVADIRKAKPTDVRWIMRIENSLPCPWVSGWLSEEVAEAVTHPDYRTLFVSNARYPIGWITGRRIAGGIIVKRIAVEPLSWKHGFGRSMLDELSYQVPGVHECEIPFDRDFDGVVLFMKHCGFTGRLVTRNRESFIHFTKGK